MKKLISLAMSLLLLASTAFAVDLYVDDQLIKTDTPPTAVDGRILVPVRAIFEALGATVEWDNSTWTATGTKGDTVIVIHIGDTTAYVNGEAKTLDVPAQIINGRTMVPARFVSESLDCDVTWYGPASTAAVAYEWKGQQIYVTKSGKKYHFSDSCNGGTYYEATLAEAMGRGLEPCDKCVLTKPSAQSSKEPTSSQRSAVSKAKEYLDIMAFSHDGLVDQLEFEGFSTADATYGADHCGADWNAQALAKAKSYLDIKAFSYSGLIDQLEFDQYTTAQATYGADNCGADWNEQAAKAAASYLALMSFSRDRLIGQLEFDGFTHDQAVYGAEQNGL